MFSLFSFVSGRTALFRSADWQKSSFRRRGRRKTEKVRTGFSLTRLVFALAKPERTQRNFTEASGVANALGPHWRAAPAFFPCWYESASWLRIDSPRAPFLEPNDVTVVGLHIRERQWFSSHQGRHGARVLPTADFRVPICKRQTTCSIVVRTGKNGDPCSQIRRFRV